MTTRSLARRLPALGTSIALALVIAACGSAGVSSPPATGSPATGSPSAPTPGTPGPTVFDVGGLAGSLADLDGTTVTVDGFFLISDGTARLCEMVLESYPPQCGGATLRVLGKVPQEVLDALETTSDPILAQASWGTVSITGIIGASGADGTPTITIESISVVPPVGG
jgi:hypothetical protein